MCMLAIIAGAAKQVGLEKDGAGWMRVPLRAGLSLLKEKKATYFRPKGDHLWINPSGRLLLKLTSAHEKSVKMSDR